MTGEGSGTLTYSASGLPSGLSINSSTGIISGTLGSGDDADSPYDATITVSNGTYSTSQDVLWIVNPRVVLFSPGDQSNSDNDVVSLSLSSMDGAGSSVTYSASGLPSGLSINSTTGLISGTIGSSADASSPYSITLTAGDGASSTTQTITWTIAAPSITLTVPSSEFNLRGDTVSIPIMASDNNGDSFTFSASGLPAGLSINADSGIISGTISSSAVSGSPHSVTITATATGGSTASSSQTYDWTVGALTLVNPGLQQSISESTVSLFLSVNNPGSATLSYSATGLPAGLSINSSTGVISGTLSSSADTNSPYMTVVTVTGGGNSSTQTFSWTINTVELVNPGDQNSNDSEPVLLSLVASDSDAGAITYSATGLPTGLSLNTSDGLISGTIGSTDDITGTYNISVAVIDGSHSATQTFVWYISALPMFTISDQGDQSNLDSDPVFVSITALDPFGSAVSFSASGLPSGLTINPSNGIISGTIASNADATSPSSVTITAIDGGGNTATDTFNWTVVALSLTNPGSQINSLDMPLTLDLQAYSPAGSTLSYTESGLPTGLSLNTSTGVITGTPDASGNYLVTITASDGTHDLSAIFPWQITIVGVANPGDQTSSEAATVSLQLAGVGTGTVTYSASGLPAGLTLNSQTGLISGTISVGDAVNGPYTVDVAAISGLNAGSQTFTWNINPKVSVTAIDDQTSREGQAVSLQVQGSETGATLAYSAVYLPPGLSINATTGLISGTIAVGAALDGPYFVTITVSDGTYTSSDFLQWNVKPAVQPAAPSVQTTTNQTSYAGQVVSLNVNATDAADYILNYSAENLPVGLVIDPNTGIISGTIVDTAVSMTPYVVSITVDDGLGDQTTKTFLWTINPAILTAPTIYPISAVAGTDSGPLTIASFTTTDTNSQASDFVALINWGDGEMSLGVVQGGLGSFSVIASHNFAEWGTLPVSMDIWNELGATNEVVGSGTANVSPSLTGAMQLSALASQSANLTVAYFTDDNPIETGSDFTAVIAWGDGATTTATITAAGGGLFQVSGYHTYTAIGLQTATITITDAAGFAQSTTSTVEVGNLYAGVPGTLTLATFTGVSGASYTVDINWGDGTTGTGTATNASGVVTVTATHTFGVDSIDNTGSVYQIQITVTGGGSSLNTTVPVEITRPPVFFVAANVPAQSGTVLTNQVLAIYSEPDATDGTAEFAASINWGDSTSGTATVVEIGNGLFALEGSHTFSTTPTTGIGLSVSQEWGELQQFVSTLQPNPVNRAVEPLEAVLQEVIRNLNTGQPLTLADVIRISETNARLTPNQAAALFTLRYYVFQQFGRLQEAGPYWEQLGVPGLRAPEITLASIARFGLRLQNPRRARLEEQAHQLEAIYDRISASFASFNVNNLQLFRANDTIDDYRSLDLAGREAWDERIANSIHQGYIFGDCSFLSALSGAIRSRGFSWLRSNIQPVPNKPGRFRVRFFVVRASGPPSEVWVSVSVPNNAVWTQHSFATDGTLWLTLYERAYLQFREDQNRDPRPRTVNLANGIYYQTTANGESMEQAIQRLTGERAQLLNLRGSNEDIVLQQRDLIRHLQAAAPRLQIVTACTPNEFDSTQIALARRYGVVVRHAYTVIGFTPARGGNPAVVTLRNPHNNATIAGGALLRVSLDDFEQLFAAIAIEAN